MGGGVRHATPKNSSIGVGLAALRGSSAAPRQAGAAEEDVTRLLGIILGQCHGGA